MDGIVLLCEANGVDLDITSVARHIEAEGRALNRRGVTSCFVPTLGISG